MSELLLPTSYWKSARPWMPPHWSSIAACQSSHKPFSLQPSRLWDPHLSRAERQPVPGQPHEQTWWTIVLWLYQALSDPMLRDERTASRTLGGALECSSPFRGSRSTPWIRASTIGMSHRTCTFRGVVPRTLPNSYTRPAPQAPLCGCSALLVVGIQTTTYPRKYLSLSFRPGRPPDNLSRPSHWTSLSCRLSPLWPCPGYLYLPEQLIYGRWRSPSSLLALFHSSSDSSASPFHVEFGPPGSRTKELARVGCSSGHLWQVSC